MRNFVFCLAGLIASFGSPAIAQVSDEFKNAALTQGRKVFLDLQGALKENLVKSEFVLKNRKGFDENQIKDAISINRCCKLQLATGWVTPYIYRNNKEVGFVGVLGVVRHDVRDVNQFRGTEILLDPFTVVHLIDTKNAVVRFGDRPFLKLENIDSSKMAEGGEYTLPNLFYITGNAKVGSNTVLKAVALTPKEERELIRFCQSQGEGKKKPVNPFLKKWTIDGESIEAEIIDSNESTLTLMKSDFSTESIPRKNVSKSDLAWCEKNHW